MVKGRSALCFGRSILSHHYRFERNIQPALRRVALFTKLLICPPLAHMMHIFVYGTLKKGQPNYFRMLDQSNGHAHFLGRATTVEKYPLVIAGKYNIPFLLNLPGEGRRVKGEVYSVDAQMLDFLDGFEGCPTMYQRTTVQLEVNEWAGPGEGGAGQGEGAGPSAGSVVMASVYSTTAYQPEWTRLDHYESYDSDGEHGLAYHSRESRDRGASQD